MGFREDYAKTETERSATLEKTLDSINTERLTAIADIEAKAQSARLAAFEADAKASLKATETLNKAAADEVLMLISKENAKAGLGVDGKVLPNGKVLAAKVK